MAVSQLASCLLKRRSLGIFQTCFKLQSLTVYRTIPNLALPHQCELVRNLSGMHEEKHYVGSPLTRTRPSLDAFSSALNNYRVSFPVLRVHKNALLCLSEFNVRSLPVRGMAGHSKWQNIRHIKASKDAQRALVFQRYSNLIRRAVRDGGPDPKFNSKLAKIVDAAKNNNMPLSSIENAIKKSASGKMRTVEYEILGPGGCLLIVVIESDNVTRTKGEMKGICRKFQSSLVESKKNFIYEVKGIITVTNTKDESPLDADKALEVAIEAGAEDVQPVTVEEGKPILKFFCDPDDFFQVKKKVENSQYIVDEAMLEYLPKVTVELSDEEMTLVGKLCEYLNENSDVVKVYDNIQ